LSLPSRDDELESLTTSGLPIRRQMISGARRDYLVFVHAFSWPQIVDLD
jgi:hypothetical protein